MQDVCRTSIIHQHPPSRIVSNKQSDYDGVVMGVMNSFNILIRECYSLFVRRLHPWRSSKELYVLHYLQVCLSGLGRLSYWGSFYDNSYFSKWRSWWFFCLCLQLLVFMISSKEISQMPLSNEIFYLLLQIKTLVHVMPMVSVEATILAPIALVRIFIFSGHFKKGSSLICMWTCSSGMFKGVYC